MEAWRESYQTDACGGDVVNQWIDSSFTQPHPSAVVASCGNMRAALCKASIMNMRN